jgi:CheY-like chemotaxis protein
MSKTILLVDDYEPVLQTLAATLEASGFRVIATTKPSDALLIATTGHDVDLVVTDFTMPEMSGGELVREIHRRRSYLPIVMLSGAEPPCGSDCSVDAHVAKNGAMSQRNLLSAISSLLEKKEDADTEGRNSGQVRGRGTAVKG